MKLSIIIPCYNFEKYVKTCVDSILNQKLNFDFEVLIHDDQSTDKTFEVIKQLYSNKSNIIISQSNTNCGITKNLKSLFDKSNGEYIFSLDGDDYLTDDSYLQRAVNFLDSNKEYVMYCSGYRYLQSDGKIIPEEDSIFLCGLKDDVTREDLCQVNYITFARVFKNYKNLICDWMNDSIHEDWALNSEILKYGKCKCERDKCAGTYRITNVGRITSLTSQQVFDKNVKTSELIVKNTHDIDNIIIHIHLFLTKSNLEDIAYNNIKFLKQKGFKILITSPKILPERFYDIIDIFYHDKENQLLTEKYTDVEVMYHHTKLTDFALYLGVKEVQKHGLAVLRSMIKGAEVAALNNFKYIMRIEFDDLFGEKSIENVKSVISDVKKYNYDFDLIRNIYSYYTDISVHLMFYDCNKFLSVFGQIKNESDFKSELCNLGICNKSTMLETFIYLMVEHYKNVNMLNINYHNTSDIPLLYGDTQFNVHQNCFSLIDGLLSDVGYIFKNGIKENRISLMCRNFSNEKNIIVQFFIVYTNGGTYTLYMDSGGMNTFNTHYLDNANTISHISIKHGEKNFHKKYNVVLSEDNNACLILDESSGEQSLSKIELN